MSRATRETAPTLGRTFQSERRGGKRSLPIGVFGWQEGATHLECSESSLLLQLRGANRGKRPSLMFVFIMASLVC